MPEVQVNITNQQISDTLCAAFEGGSNYWYEIIGRQEPVRFDFVSDAAFAKVMEKEPKIYPHLDYPLNEGGSLSIIAPTDFGREQINGQTEWVLNLESIRRGVQVMAEKYPDHFADAVSESNGDATTGDVLLQCCLFGGIIFG